MSVKASYPWLVIEYTDSSVLLLLIIHISVRLRGIRRTSQFRSYFLASNARMSEQVAGAYGVARRQVSDSQRAYGCV